jgi:hypothetical protein
MTRWAVVAIDWSSDNVINWCDDEEEAKDLAEMYDGMALRAAAFPEGHRMIHERVVEQPDR